VTARTPEPGVGATAVRRRLGPSQAINGQLLSCRRSATASFEFRHASARRIRLRDNQVRRAPTLAGPVGTQPPGKVVAPGEWSYPVTIRRPTLV